MNDPKPTIFEVFEHFKQALRTASPADISRFHTTVGWVWSDLMQTPTDPLAIVLSDEARVERQEFWKQAYLAALSGDSAHPHIDAEVAVARLDEFLRPSIEVAA